MKMSLTNASVEYRSPEEHETTADTNRVLLYPLIALLVFFVILMIRTAWVGDDAYIAFRSIDNLLNGYGLRWNTFDRVQVFTDPLWVIIIAFFYAITHEIFLTVITLSVATAFVAVFLLVKRISSSYAAAIAGLIALISSKAFIDYTTSGLEDVLNYLLVALFCICLFRTLPTQKQFRLLILLASLAAFNRLDLALIFVPPIAYISWSIVTHAKASIVHLMRDALIYSVPVWGWLIFSTIYFGFVFPNTYYAKLYMGLPKGELFTQGLLYYVNSFNSDPTTLLVIAVAIVASISSRDARIIAGAVGLVCYLLYIVKIGGDFMAGRFFSVPLFLAVALLTHLNFRRTTWAILAILFLGAGLLAKRPAILSDETYSAHLVADYSGLDVNTVVDRRGIADERGAYFATAGLLPVLKHDRLAPPHNWALEGQAARTKGPHIVVFGTIGFYGFYAGPAVYILDFYSLGDPLLSKLTVIDRKNWRVGHYTRALPDGYVESIQSGKNAIKDPRVHELYRVIKILTQDPIWSVERFKEIAKMNLGFYDTTIRSIKGTFGTQPVERATYPMMLQQISGDK